MTDRNRTYRSSPTEVSWRDRKYRDGYSELQQEQFSRGRARGESASAGRGQKGGSFVGLDYGRFEMGSPSSRTDEGRDRAWDNHSGQGPANYVRSDERILEDACDNLTDDPGTDARNVHVTVRDSEITLDGTVGSREQKHRAERSVERISGVRHVQNNLRVK